MKAFIYTLETLLTLLVVAMIVAMLIAVKSDLLIDIKELKTDVIMYESMVEGLILTNREQHNMLLECMEGDKK